MFQLWHGGRRWDGQPEVQPPRKGRCECGPGIYLTTRYERARKCAAGNGIATLVDLADNITWLEQKQLPVQVLQEYVLQTRGFRKRASVLADLEYSAERLGRELIPVNCLVNLCVNHDVLSGEQGLNLARWLVEQGIDASLHCVNLQEQWVVVFNPAIIQRFKAVSAAKVTPEQRELPHIQLSA